MFESVPELFRYIIKTITVLKGEVVFVFLGHHFPTFGLVRPRTFELSTFAKDIHGVIFAQTPRIFQPLVVGVTIADKPGHSWLPHTNKVCMAVIILLFLIPIIAPPTVGRGQGAVSPVCCCPVCLAVKVRTTLSTFQLINHPKLGRTGKR